MYLYNFILLLQKSVIFVQEIIHYTVLLTQKYYRFQFKFKTIMIRIIKFAKLYYDEDLNIQTKVFYFFLMTSFMLDLKKRKNNVFNLSYC